MGHPICLPEQYKMVSLLAPAADAAGRDGDFVSLKNALKAWIVVHITQGNAATVALIPKQATVVAGTDTKVLANAVPIWSNLDEAASDALVRRTAAVNYTTDAGVKNKIIVFEIDPAQLDINNGFDCISLTTGASHASNITEAMVILLPAYPGSDPVGGPSAIVD